MVFNGLIEAVADSVRDGVVPKPISGESVDDFRFRCAHAGALLGIRWATEQALAQQAEEQARVDALETPPDEGRHGGATVTPLGATPSEQNEHPETGEQDAG